MLRKLSTAPTSARPKTAKGAQAAATADYARRGEEVNVAEILISIGDLLDRPPRSSGGMVTSGEKNGKIQEEQRVGVNWVDVYHEKAGGCSFFVGTDLLRFGKSGQCCLAQWGSRL